jgi:hypothetical protein
MDEGAPATSQQQTNHRSSLGKLPTELWLIILNMVEDSSIIRLERSNLLTFPYKTDYLTRPGHRTDLVISRRKLSLVCRTFHALLVSSPHYFMGSGEKPIPASTKALYFDDYHRDSNGVPLLGPQTSICQRLVYINTVCAVTEPAYTGFPITFDILSELSPSLPSIRSLSLRLQHRPRDQIIEISFWLRLSCAFPRLLTLEVNQNSHNNLFLTKKTDKMASFERLEVLYMDPDMTYTPMLHPNLRHVAIRDSSLSNSQLEALKKPPLLESMLLRAPRGRGLVGLDVTALPHLRLLGVLMQQIYSMIALGPNHPLEHLWIIVDEEADMKRIVDLVLEKMPGIAQITFDSALCIMGAWHTIMSTIRRFSFSSPVWRVSSEGAQNTTITLQRIPEVPQLESIPVPIGQADDPEIGEADGVSNGTATIVND